MPLDWQPLLELVNTKNHFLLTCHTRPDGDALGSILALGETLKQKGKTVQLVVPGNLPPRYDFLLEQAEIMEFEPGMEKEFNGVDAIIVMDTGTWNQLSKLAEFVRSSAATKLVIDHHVTQDDLGGKRLVDTTAEANCRLAWEAAHALGATVTRSLAENVFMGLAMDTGWFRHNNTKDSSFVLAADLIRSGARIEYLYQSLYDTNSIGRQRLQGMVLQNLLLTHQNRTCYAAIKLCDYPKLGAKPSDSEDLVNLTMTVQGVEIGVLFLEQLAGGTKVSLRAKGKHQVSKVAEKFGGGGHPAASGVILQEKMEEAIPMILNEVERTLMA